MNISSQKSVPIRAFLFIVVFCFPGHKLLAQTGPSRSEADSYSGIHLAAHLGDLSLVQELIADGAPLEETDRSGRTALHIAAFASHEDNVIVLANAGANMNALEHQAYDIVTIAAVANDYEMLDVALNNGTSPGNVTSPYDGTALIAAAHLGHHHVVKR
jgi:ankyrin repeat protein